MIRFLGDIYAILFGRPLFEKINKGLFYLASRGLGIRNYTSSRISGEKYICDKYIPKSGKPIIFDVGANKGNWSKSVFVNNPNCIIHAFEPNKANAKELNEIADKVKVNFIAIGDKIGTMDIHDYKGNVGSEHASLLNGVIENIHQKTSESHTIDVTTLDDYCIKNDIKNIDFIKIDTEGYEYQILLGAKNTLEKTKFLQFEFNEMNVISRIFFRDFFKLLSQNFTLYRILPNGLIKIEKYSSWHCEQFTFQNILAVNKNE